MDDQQQVTVEDARRMYSHQNNADRALGSPHTMEQVTVTFPVVVLVLIFESAGGLDSECNWAHCSPTCLLILLKEILYF
jgi:hypothetical protein